MLLFIKEDFAASGPGTRPLGIKKRDFHFINVGKLIMAIRAVIDCLN